MQCHYCGKHVEQTPGKREKLYCNDVCKQLAYRRRKQSVNMDVDDMPKDSTQKNTYATMLAELNTLRTVVEQQHQAIELHKQTILEKLTELDRLRRILTHQATDLKQLDALREKLRNQEKTIVELEIGKAELTSELSRLYHRLDVERRFLEDKEKLPFKAWLKKQTSPLKEKLSTDEHYAQLLPRGTRSYYDYRLRVQWHCTEEEMEEFARLWKLLLLQS